MAGEVRGEHAGERRVADEICRRAGAGRGHRPRPGARRSRRALVAEEGRRAAAGVVPLERRGGHVGRRPLGDDDRGVEGGEVRAAVRLSDRPRRQRPADVGPPGPGDGRGRVRRGRRGGDRPGLDRAAQAAVAAGGRRGLRRTGPLGCRPPAVRLSRPAVVAGRAMRAGAGQRRREHHAPAGRGDADRADEDRPRAHVGTGRPRLRPGSGRAIGRRGRGGGGRRADRHGLRPALPRHRADLLARDARIGAGLRPLQHQAGRGRFRGHEPAGRGDRGEDRGG